MPELGVVVVDPLPAIRAGLALLVNEDARLEMFDEAGSVEDALERLKEMPRHSRVVVVVGLEELGLQESYSLIRQIRSVHPALKVVACAPTSDPNTISRALFLGADGFIDQRTPLSEFTEVLIRTSRDEAVVLDVPEAAV